MPHRKFLTAILIAALSLPLAAQRHVPKDLSTVRGFNYQGAETNGHVEYWLKYDPAATQRDLDYAKRLQLNQVRIFVPYDAWEQDKEALKKNLIDFVRAAHARGMGVMPTIMYKHDEWKDKAAWPNARPFVADLVAAVGKEPGLAMWDVENEPACCKLPVPPDKQLHMQHAMYMARVFHELDPVTPVTIGATFVDNMIYMADAVDVLSFHDYSHTRAEIRANIEKAKAYAAKVGKPLIDSEIGCIARDNPYDVTLEEHMREHVGWYIWELMITKYWGNVHGVFYADGTVRDPSIVAALMGFFRNRDLNTMVMAVPNREGNAEAAIQEIEAVLSTNQDKIGHQPVSTDKMLDAAEKAANLLEAAQMTPMNLPPTAQIRYWRQQPEEKRDRLAIREFTYQLGMELKRAIQQY